MSQELLAYLFAALVGVALWVYALTAGADFGGGVWDLLASGPRKGAQRALIARAIGPIWEANHVWMILVVVLLFVCFPTAFAAIMTALHAPIALMLVGITLRGASFVFRAYGPKTEGSARWGSLFAASSAVTPVLLGVVLGAVSSGAIRLDRDRRVVTDFLSEWLAVFPWALGAMVLALFSYLAAVYLCVEAQEDALREDFRRRAVGANVAFGVTAALAGLASVRGAPHIAQALAGDATAWAMQGLTAAVAIGALVALRARRDRWARALAMLQVTLVFGGWVASQRGFLLYGALRPAEAAAPVSILRPVLAALAAGSLALVPAFVGLFRVFKSQLPAGATDDDH
jgi:cytochrome d ubiquinol oxidase subunit II